MGRAFISCLDNVRSFIFFSMGLTYMYNLTMLNKEVRAGQLLGKPAHGYQ